MLKRVCLVLSFLFVLICSGHGAFAQDDDLEKAKKETQKMVEA